MLSIRVYNVFDHIALAAQMSTLHNESWPEKMTYPISLAYIQRDTAVMGNVDDLHDAIGELIHGFEERVVQLGGWPWVFSAE